MWQCASQAPGGGTYFGLTGFGSGPAIAWVIRAASLFFDSGALYHRAPLDDLRREKGPECLGGSRARVHAEILQPIAHFGCGDCSVDLAAKPIDHDLGRFCRRGDAVPRSRLVAAHAALRNGRNIRQPLVALVGRYCERPEGTALDLRHHRCQDFKRHLHVIALQRKDDRGRCLERNNLRLDSRHRLEKFRSEVLRAADVDRADVELVGIRPCRRNQFTHRADLRIRVHHHYEVKKADGGNRGKVVQRVVGQRLEQGRAHRIAVGDEEQGVAVWFRLRDRFRRDDSPSARPVLDEHLLTHRLAHFLREDAGGDVGYTAGSEGHDDLHRPGRVALGKRRRRGYRKRGSANPTQELYDCLGNRVELVGAARFELATTCTPFSSMILQTFLSTTYVHASAAICLTMLNNAQLMDTKLTQQFFARPRARGYVM